MCEFFDFQASGQNLDLGGTPTQLEIFGRVTTDCALVDVTVTDNSNNIIFQGQVTPDPAIIPFAGVDTRNVIATFDNSSVRCDERVTIVMTCADDPTCTLTVTVQVNCKIPPVNCPDSSTIQIAVENADGPVTENMPCIPTGNYTATLTGAPAGSTVFWTLEIGSVPQSLGSANPVTFALPAGSDAASLSAVVIIPNCPPLTRTFVFPDRNAEDCPANVTFEILRNGAIIAETSDLECGNYTMNVLTPLTPGTLYTFTINGVVQPTSTSSSFPFSLPASNTVVSLIVTADSGDCCPPVSNFTTLESGLCDDDDDDDDDDNDNDNGGGGFSICGFLYGILIALVLAFIALWIASFAFFPVAAALWVALGIAFALVLAAIAVYSWICSMNFCRRLRVLAWMFAWCAIGCLIAWAASLFTLWPALIGALIAGIITLALGLWMNSRNCAFPNLFTWP